MKFLLIYVNGEFQLLKPLHVNAHNGTGVFEYTYELLQTLVEMGRDLNGTLSTVLDFEAIN